MYAAEVLLTVTGRVSLSRQKAGYVSPALWCCVMDRIELFSSNDETTSIEVRLTGETVWLTQQQIAELFETSRENIAMHLRNVFSEGELDEKATCKDFLQVRQEGFRNRQ
ncbi:hypothetical protein [Brevibacterium atlanticum]|uniref:hypothetical protein n=1 Tax=Brevibacterium atlanticum TaxID=2697563 RepID=UPI001AA0DBEC|nr:hypothetical protein [Brevibacterium atlanticum]